MQEQSSGLLFEQVGAVRIAYDRHGSKDAPIVVLVHGLGQQLTAWPLALVQQLVQDGVQVVRIDNRDIGQSSRMHGKPNLPWLLLLNALGIKGQAPYYLDDMAHDLCLFIEKLSHKPVHLVGASMGGMICQIAAARYPHIAQSLTSIMSSSGNPKLPGAKPDVHKHVLQKVKFKTREQEINRGVKTWQLIGSPKYPTPVEELRKIVTRDLERNFPDMGGIERQLAAIVSSGSRVELLKIINCPSMIIHGSDDPLVPIECGEDTAHNIPGATIARIDGMGHDLPAALIPRIARILKTHFATIESPFGLEKNLC